MPPPSTAPDASPSGPARARLLAYLVDSYLLAYLAHIPIHHGLTHPTNPIIPALVPWGIAACVAVVRYARKQSFVPAWCTLAVVTAFFLLGHLIPHATR